MLERLPLLSSGISLRPALAVEISPAGVLAARQDSDILSANFVPLPPEALNPGWKSPNILDRARIVAALRSTLNAVAERGRALPGGRNMPGNRALTVIVPDAAVRVLLLDFDTLPSKSADVIPILRFRLRKLVPFEVDDAAISYQTMPNSSDQVRVLVTVIPRDVLAEYESVVRETGFYAGVVLPSTLAASTLLGAEPALIVNRNGNTLTTVITRGDTVLLHRAQEFERGERALPGHMGEDHARADDIRQSVSVAMAYFEDTLAQLPSVLYYIGPGSADEFSSLLGPDFVGGNVANAEVPVLDAAPGAYPERRFDADGFPLDFPEDYADATSGSVTSYADSASSAEMLPYQPALTVRELVSASSVSANAIPKALLAPVAGALSNE